VPDGTVMMTTAVDSAAALGSDMLSMYDFDLGVKLIVQISARSDNNPRVIREKEEPEIV